MYNVMPLNGYAKLIAQRWHVAFEFRNKYIIYVCALSTAVIGLYNYDNMRDNKHDN